MGLFVGLALRAIYAATRPTMRWELNAVASVGAAVRGAASAPLATCVAMDMATFSQLSCASKQYLLIAPQSKL